MKFISLILIPALSLTGCASYSKQARTERAYAKYVNKASMGRVKKRSMFHSNTSARPPMPITPTSNEPVESTSSGPQSVPPDN